MLTNLVHVCSFSKEEQPNLLLISWQKAKYNLQDEIICYTLCNDSLTVSAYSGKIVHSLVVFIGCIHISTAFCLSTFGSRRADMKCKFALKFSLLFRRRNTINCRKQTDAHWNWMNKCFRIKFAQITNKISIFAGNIFQYALNYLLTFSGFSKSELFIR